MMIAAFCQKMVVSPIKISVLLGHVCTDGLTGQILFCVCIYIYIYIYICVCVCVHIYLSIYTYIKCICVLL